MCSAFAAHRQYRYSARVKIICKDNNINVCAQIARGFHCINSKNRAMFTLQPSDISAAMIYKNPIENVPLLLRTTGQEVVYRENHHFEPLA